VCGYGGITLSNEYPKSQGWQLFTTLLLETAVCCVYLSHHMTRSLYMWASIVPRPPRPAFIACSTKIGWIYHMMRATAASPSVFTSGFVLSPSLFFPWIQFVLSVLFVLRVQLLLDRSWLATVRDISRGTHHMINPSRPSPCFSYCSQQKLGVEAWEWGYIWALWLRMCNFPMPSNIVHARPYTPDNSTLATWLWAIISTQVPSAWQV